MSEVQTAIAVGSIVIDLADRRRQSVVATITVEAGVVSELLRVAAEVELVVGLPVIAERS